MERVLPGLLLLVVLGAPPVAQAQPDPPGTIRLTPPPRRPTAAAPWDPSAGLPKATVAPTQPSGPTIPGVPTPATPPVTPTPDGGVPAPTGPTIPGVPTPATPAPDGGVAAPVTPPPAGAPPSAAPPSPPAPKPEDGLKPGWAPHAGAVIDLGGQKRVFVGDVFSVRITVIARASVPVNLPASLDLGDFSLVGRGALSTERLDGDQVRHSFTLRVSAFNVGELELPAIPVTYVPPREAFEKPPEAGQPIPALVVTTPPVRQRISSVLANEPQPQLKKNAPPVPILVEDRRMRTALIVLVALLLGAALGFVIFWFVRNRRRTGPPPPPPRPADEIALEKLTALRAAGLLERGEMKELYLGVSEAIRDYLGNRYGFDSLEMTTTELAEQMQKVTLTGLRLHELIHFLQDCDLVKFAKYIPPLVEAERILAQAEHIVRVTRFVPAPPEDDGGVGTAPRPVPGQHAPQNPGPTSPAATSSGPTFPDPKGPESTPPPGEGERHG